MFLGCIVQVDCLLYKVCDCYVGIVVGGMFVVEFVIEINYLYVYYFIEGVFFELYDLF